ncbi:MAG: hypothetical protein KGR26_04575, partial [Cyanobacteria bacterium REEB65]|nr:hypothetical protein [Cyanobacteria bacterium REEB65]
AAATAFLLLAPGAGIAQTLDGTASVPAPRPTIGAVPSPTTPAKAVPASKNPPTIRPMTAGHRTATGSHLPTLPPSPLPSRSPGWRPHPSPEPSARRHAPAKHHRVRVGTDALDNPRDVVEEFCELDADGVRLGTSPLRQEISRLTTWDEEPGWDEATVIRSFSLGDVESYGDFAHVEVHFSVIGTATPDRLAPMPPDQSVVFNLERSGKIWRIESPLYEPHVFRRALLRRLSVTSAAPALLKALTQAH